MQFAEIMGGVFMEGEENKTKPERGIKGRFKEYADPELRKLEKEAWARAVVEKFGKKSEPQGEDVSSV